MEPPEFAEKTAVDTCDETTFEICFKADWSSIFGGIFEILTEYLPSGDFVICC